MEIERLEFLNQLALRPLFDMGVAGYWIYAGFSIEKEPGQPGSFRELFTLNATTSKDGLVAGRFVLTTAYKRVPVQSSLPARVFSAVHRAPIGETLEFWSSVHAVTYQTLYSDNIGRDAFPNMRRLWATSLYNHYESWFCHGQNAYQMHRQDAKVYEIYECLMVLLLERDTERPLYEGSITRCFDLPRVWLAHGDRFEGGRDCRLGINCSMKTCNKFFSQYALLAREFRVISQGYKCGSLDLRGLNAVSVAESAAAFFPNTALVIFSNCNLRAISAFLKRAPRVTHATIDSGRQVVGDTEDVILLCGGVEFVETCMSHPALHNVTSSQRGDGLEWVTDQLTLCVQHRRSIDALMELDAPSLEQAMHEQPGAQGPPGVAAFFRNALFERNVLAIISGFACSANVGLLITAIAAPPVMKKHRPDPHFIWRTDDTIW